MGFLTFVIAMAFISLASTTKESRAKARQQTWAIWFSRTLMGIAGAIVLSFIVMG